MFDSSKLTTLDDEWQSLFAAENKKMRLRTGGATTTDPLVVFLYLLMRDVVPSGTIEQKASEAIISCQRGEGSIIFTNGYLSGHAADLAERFKGAALQEKPEPPPRPNPPEIEVLREG